MNKTIVIILLFIACFHKVGYSQDKNNTSIAVLEFKNRVENADVVLYDQQYTNPFGEKYDIRKLRYYISNIVFHSHSGNYSHSGYYLIDQAKPASRQISIPLPEGTYQAVSFLLGVDSLHNVSGAQAGVLDPTQDMFWTWNTGYVMVKMEGRSPASHLVNHKYEFHAGGFSGPYSVLKNIPLSFPETVLFPENKTTVITILADINSFWKGKHSIKIAENANITSPGKWAFQLSENYARMFSIAKITTLP